MDNKTEVEECTEFSNVKTFISDFPVENELELAGNFDGERADNDTTGPSSCLGGTDSNHTSMLAGSNQNSEIEATGVVTSSVTTAEEQQALLEAKERTRRESKGVVCVPNKTRYDDLITSQLEGWRAKLLARFATVPEKKEYFPKPRENYISVPASQLIQTIISEWKSIKGPSEAQKLEALCRSISSFYNVYFRAKTENLLNLYTYFDEQNADERVAKEELLSAELEAREDLFLNQLGDVLVKGNYCLMRELEMTEALRLNYNLSVEIDLDLTKLDGRLFFRHFQGIDDNELMYRADITDHMLLLHRGTGLVSKTDMFVKDKINLILSRAWAVLYGALYALCQKLGLVRRLTTARSPAMSPPGMFSLPANPAALALLAFVSIIYVYTFHQHLVRQSNDISSLRFAGWLLCEVLIGASLFFAFLYSPNHKVALETDVEKSRRQRAKWRNLYPDSLPVTERTIERIRLDNLRLLPQDIFERHTIQEPTFKDLVLVYRPAGTNHIILKEFQDVPRADVELIFPFKTFKLLSTDSAIVAVTLAMGLSTVVSTAIDSRQLNSHLWTTLALGLAALAYRVNLKKRMAVQIQEADVMDSLLSKMVGDGRSLILELVGNCKDQETAEAVLGYYMLLLNGPQQEAMLDEQAEAFLLNRFQQDIDFEVADSLQKLLALGLVKFDEQTNQYACLPVEKASEKLAALWASLDIGTQKLETEHGLGKPMDEMEAEAHAVHDTISSASRGVVGARRSIVCNVGRPQSKTGITFDLWQNYCLVLYV